MEELIETVAAKAGITPEQAKDAITTVIDHFKDKLPWGLGEKIESYISGDVLSSESPSTGAEGIFDDLKGKVSGLFS